jgi:DNA-binding beta-propeller fold protein YncE
MPSIRTITIRKAAGGLPWPAMLGLGAIILLAACVLAKPETPPPAPVYRVWPDPPAEPRVVYRQSIRSPEDAGLRLAGENWLSRLLFNEDKTRGKLVRPFGLALDESGNLCIADTGSATISYLDFSRKRWQTWDKIGPVTLVAPVAVVRQAGIFYVADSGLAKVIAFDAKGKLLFASEVEFERPAGLAILDGRLLVADAAAHKIVVLDLAGKFLSAFGTRGTGPGQFNYPTHLATDTRGRLFVTDSMNFRVQIFDAVGHYEKAFGQAGDGSGMLSRPKGVGVDRQGNVYLVDALFDNVQIFTESGEFLLGFGEHGNGPGEFWLPAGIAASPDGRIYVADSYNGRIQVFQQVPKP